MKNFFYSQIKLMIDRFLTGIEYSRFGKHVFHQIINGAMLHNLTLVHGGITLLFAIPNEIPLWRAESFSTKEPETLQWIDSMGCHPVIEPHGMRSGRKGLSKSLIQLYYRICNESFAQPAG